MTPPPESPMLPHGDESPSTGIQVERMIGVYCGTRKYRFDNVQVWPVAEFVKSLFAGEVF